MNNEQQRNDFITIDIDEPIQFENERRPRWKLFTMLMIGVAAVCIVGCMYLKNNQASNQRQIMAETTERNKFYLMNLILLEKNLIPAEVVQIVDTFSDRTTMKNIEAVFVKTLERAKKRNINTFIEVYCSQAEQSNVYMWRSEKNWKQRENIKPHGITLNKENIIKKSMEEMIKTLGEKFVDDLMIEDVSEITEVYQSYLYKIKIHSKVFKMWRAFKNYFNCSNNANKLKKKIGIGA